MSACDYWKRYFHNLFDYDIGILESDTHIKYHCCQGAAYSGAEAEIQYLVTRNSLPFLPTPMGKGVISDDHPLCVAPARSR